VDYDLDGRRDFVPANSWAEPDVNRFEAGREFSSVPSVKWNDGRGFVNIPIENGPGPESSISLSMPRGVAVADFDGDGDSDLAIAQHRGGPRLFRNDQRGVFPWLQIDLIATGGPKEAGGARVEVHTPRQVLMQTVVPATGYMAQSSSTLTFGLGEDARVRKVVVHWPSGRRTETKPQSLSRKIVIVEAASANGVAR
jgi:hypothetical protein